MTVADSNVVTVPAWKKWVPTKKWFVALATGVSAIVISIIESGDFGSTEQAGLKTLAVTLIAAYLKSNNLSLGGIPGAIGIETKAK